MRQSLLSIPAVAGLLLLTACGAASSAQDAPAVSQDAGAPAQGGMMPPGQGMPRQGMAPEDLQAFADAANAAPDKTVLTKEQFMAEMQALMEAQRAKFQQQSSGMARSSFPGGMGRGRFGGQRSSGAMHPDRLADAATYLKYTDADGAEVLLALDADGKAVMKWPRAFGGPGGGRAPMMDGDGNVPPAQQ